MGWVARPSSFLCQMWSSFSRFECSKTENIDPGAHVTTIIVANALRSNSVGLMYPGVE